MLILNIICNIVNKFIKGIGIRNSILGIVLVVILGQGLVKAYGMEKNVIIEPILNYGNIVEEEKQIEVVREFKSSDGFSFTSLLLDDISNINSELEAMSLEKQLIGSCENISHKKQTLNIPKGAGGIKLEKMIIYTWIKRGRNWLTNSEFGEYQIVMLYGGQYVKLRFAAKNYLISLTGDIEVGNY